MMIMILHVVREVYLPKVYYVDIVKEIYYTTHQFFLSTACISVLVFKNLWKTTNSSFGSIQHNAPKSTVFIVGTFLDQLEKNISKRRGKSIEDIPRRLRLSSLHGRQTYQKIFVSK